MFPPLIVHHNFGVKRYFFHDVAINFTQLYCYVLRGLPTEGYTLHLDVNLTTFVTHRQKMYGQILKYRQNRVDEVK